MLAKSFPQFPVAGIPPNYILRIGLKQILQGESPLGHRQIVGRAAGNLQKRILGRARHIILNLHHQGGHNIEVLMNAGKLIEQLDHSVVVLEGVQTHPGQAVFTCNQILVERLVLMPKKDDAQGGHGWRSQSSMQVKASISHQWTRPNRPFGDYSRKILDKSARLYILSIQTCTATSSSPNLTADPCI